MKFTKSIRVLCLIISALLWGSSYAVAQAELMPWGDLNGIRIQGQLMGFTTNLNVVTKNWAEISSSGKERQRPKFKRTGSLQVVNTIISGIKFTESVEDEAAGSVKVTVQFEVPADQDLTGVYLGLHLDKKRYSGKNSFSINPSNQAVLNSSAKNAFNGWNYLPIHEGSVQKGRVYEKSFVIKISAEVDHSTVQIKLNNTVKGRAFDGLGGNFRLQNLKTDPQVIDYCLKNLRVAWGRVEMPWKDWQNNLSNDPMESAKNGNLNKHVERSMQMAQRLGKLGIPVIVSAWSPPQWAVVGELKNGPDPKGVWGNPLKKDVMKEIYSSITNYLLYLKSNFGVEAKYFSFNESDLGINVRQTGQEHADLIKGLGAFFKSKGLETKLLLGDNSDANTYEFIYPALNDPACRPYIGAISFHSWRGWETETLKKWADAATKIGAEILVGEGSIDAAAWQYPAYFEEESYALEEINLYTRLLNICQPQSILQWQLTADYSPLKGGGIFGDDGPLAPTQRFWQLKQLANTAPGQRHVAAFSNRSDISCAALAGTNSTYTIHLVNTSAGRTANIKGIPPGLKKFKAFVTDQSRNIVQLGDVVVKAGEANFPLPARCYMTLVSD
jgi:O-glycosyl hydrolase